MPLIHAVLVSAATTQPKDDSITALFSALESILPIIQFGTLALGVLVMLIGAFRFIGSMYRGQREGISNLVMGGAMALFAGVFIPIIRGLGEEGENTATPKPQATDTPRPSAEAGSAPEVARDAVDLTWLWVGLGVIAGMILLALLIWLLVTLSSKARRGIREAQKRQMTKQEEAERLQAAWQHFHDVHDELLRKVLHAETDWDSLFSMPALTDPNVGQTHLMHRAMRNAGTLRRTSGEMPTDLAPDMDLTRLPYPAAVEDFAIAWDLAEQHAKRIGQKKVPAAERKLIKEIRTLLDMAENPGASQTERTLAYRRAQKLIENLESVNVPTKAFAQLEERQNLMLTAATSPAS